MNRRICAVVVFLIILAAATAAAAAEFVMINRDGSNEGFNDRTPAPAAPLNPGITIGEQRRYAFARALAIWGNSIHSDVPIVVYAHMAPLACSPTSATLAISAPVHAAANFPGAPLPNTWYHISEANAIAGTDLNNGEPGNTGEIDVVFNRALGETNCLTGVQWYYGLDGNPPAGMVDFVTIAMHELTHGLGFLSFVYPPTGEKGYALPYPFDDAYMLNLEHVHLGSYADLTDAERAAANRDDPNLVWVGPAVTKTAMEIGYMAGMTSGYVRVHAPAQLVLGSSLNHFSAALKPDEVLEPGNLQPSLDPGLALSALEDMGWTMMRVDIATFDVAEVDEGVSVSATFGPLHPRADVTLLRARDDGIYDEVAVFRNNKETSLSYVDDTILPGYVWRYMLAVDYHGKRYYSEEREVTVPRYLTYMSQSAPNPFGATAKTTTIRYELAATARVEIAVFNVQGGLVKTLVSNQQGRGRHEASWDARDNNGNAVPSGVYFYRLESDIATQTRRLVVLR